jgi:hypothetical protein
MLSFFVGHFAYNERGIIPLENEFFSIIYKIQFVPRKKRVPSQKSVG